MNILNKKKILFFSADLFGYQSEISDALAAKGALVHYYDERPSNSFLVKALIRLNRNFLSYYIDCYYSKIIKKTKDNHYDYVFVIKGESISASSLNRIKAHHPNAIFILYLWDSIRNNKNAIRNLSFFNKVFSFDRLDCEAYGLEFHPLFYISNYKKISNPKGNDCVDFLFIATVHSDRYEFCKKIELLANEYNKICYFYFYFRSRLLFFKMKILNSSFSKAKITDFHFSSLTKFDVINLFERSRIIIDVQHPNQTGLTMRSIEVLGAKRKLITTNADIKNYDFYNPSNILIVDRDDPKVPVEFIELDYVDIPIEIYEKYELKNWLNYIFFDSNRL